MTEKRFIDGGAECIEDQFLVDTETDTYYWIDDGLDNIIELLNKLEKENEQLKLLIAFIKHMKKCDCKSCPVDEYIQKVMCE